MADLSGDIPNEAKEWPTIRFGSEIYFDERATVRQLEEDPTLYSLSDVIEVIVGDIEAILPLIGYPKESIVDYLKDDELKATDEIIEELQKLGPRPPDSHLVVHNNFIYGVVVDEKNESRIAGRMTSVIPQNPKPALDVISVGEEGLRMFYNSKHIDLKSRLEDGAILSMVANKGYAFIEPLQKNTEEMSHLILMLSEGYVLFEDLDINWVRLRKNKEMTKSSIGSQQCVVFLRSGCIREDNQYVIYGNQHIVLDFESFLAFTDQMTIDFTGDQQNTSESPNHPSEDEDMLSEKLRNTGIRDESSEGESSEDESIEESNE